MKEEYHGIRCRYMTTERSTQPESLLSATDRPPHNSVSDLYPRRCAKVASSTVRPRDHKGLLGIELPRPTIYAKADVIVSSWLLTPQLLTARVRLRHGR